MRLREGRADAETVFSDDPVAMAERWATLGAERLHVVDLDGAFAGAPRQTALIAKIVAAVAPGSGRGRRRPARPGGASRPCSRPACAWAVVGTRAAARRRVPARGRPRASPSGSSSPSTRAAIAWPSRAGRRPATITVIDVGRRARDGRRGALLYTDVSRDGTELGPERGGHGGARAAVGLPVLASGGVGRVDDLVRLAARPRRARAPSSAARSTPARSIAAATRSAGGRRGGV